jgi:hypothetical protein
MKYAILPFTLMAAFAAGEKLRGETFCFPAKDVPKLVSELGEVKAERRDIVDVRLKPRFIIKDDGIWPDRFYLSKDGELVTEMPFSRETGAVPSFIEAASARPDTDICVDDPTRADRPYDDEGLYFEMGLAPLFKSTPGKHSLAELEEAAKDGKKFYKKMLPSALAIFMPDTDYFGIRMRDREAVPTAAAFSGDIENILELEPVNDMWVVSLDDIEDLDASYLVIGGGEYDLQPVPSPKTMRKFGMADAVEEE